jgi:hypothetical protein
MKANVTIRIHICFRGMKRFESKRNCGIQNLFATSSDLTPSPSLRGRNILDLYPPPPFSTGERGEDSAQNKQYLKSLSTGRGI